ncbi:hypothetical protein AB1L07_02540 [Niallia alba]|uniref:hypothetical protein n=1 Tax=Niallia alba TaxID=2729105 RepID=UPI00399F3FC9
MFRLYGIELLTGRVIKTFGKEGHHEKVIASWLNNDNRLHIGTQLLKNKSILDISYSDIPYTKEEIKGLV